MIFVTEQQKKNRSPLSIFSTFPDFVSEHNSIIKESLLALLICAIGDLCAGVILGKMTFFLETFPGLLVIIPGAIGMRGNIFWFIRIKAVNQPTHWYNFT